MYLHVAWKVALNKWQYCHFSKHCWQWVGQSFQIPCSLHDLVICSENCIFFFFLFAQEIEGAFWGKYIVIVSGLNFSSTSSLTDDKGLRWIFLWNLYKHYSSCVWISQGCKKTWWLKTPIYCLIVLLAKSIKSRCGQDHTLHEHPGEDPSSPL